MALNQWEHRGNIRGRLVTKSNSGKSESCNPTHVTWGNIVGDGNCREEGGSLFPNVGQSI